MVKRALAAFAVLSFATAAFAQDFPKRPITMIVPFGAGGTSDVVRGAGLEQPVRAQGHAGGGHHAAAFAAC
ncbi:hypothetical protein JJE66_32545 [Bradyrhizobium diazoefficiens]|uniref:hypothetical protein n=1 Tax=Bradyrhizobium diazoefficiens TaxID=1355477 RepID=UPI0019095F60|nr:hypothetical protein [Bradyrhizobium diazoefficiens]MBK3665937.1 hypothetical protein [Bradyrhizobium diazoefficiens]